MDKEVADTFINIMRAFDAIEATFAAFLHEAEADGKKIDALELRISALEKRMEAAHETDSKV